MAKVGKVMKEKMARAGYVTVPEVARRIGQSEGQVRKWVTSKAVRYQSVGSVRFVSLASVAKLLGPGVAQILGLEAR